MNNLRIARILMAVTILLLMAFQVYWMRKLYYEENENFKKTADILFWETIYQLKLDRFSNDSLMLKGANLFITNLISSTQKIKATEDSSKKKLFITIDTHTRTHLPDSQKQGFTFQRKTKFFPNGNEENNSMKEMEDFLANNTVINDTIPIRLIDSLYKTLLRKEGITVGYSIIKVIPSIKDVSNLQYSIKEIDTFSNNVSTKTFVTRKIPVGLWNSLFYKAEFKNAFWYIVKKIAPQLALSALLVLLTVLSFVFIYRNLLAQKRLTQIKNEFIGNITHELKTPISTVSVAIEAMKNFSALQNPERTKEYLEIATQELGRLSLLVDKVLRLSMFETQQVQLKYEQFDLKALIEEVISSMQLQFEKFSAKVNFRAQGEDFLVRADRMHITSVIYNLLDNALKYSKNKPLIEMNLSGHEGELIFTVKDDGIGIPVAYQEKIFDKFFRVPQGNQHNVKGYGLGLSYVAHIVAEHNGRVTVQSEEGKGTTFIIKLLK